MARGNPSLLIRFEPEAIDAAQQAFPSVKGRSGGVSLAIRRLLYLALDISMPRQFGEVGRAKAIDSLEERMRSLESLPFDPTSAESIGHEIRKAYRASAGDAVDILRLRALLGRLALWESP